MPYERIRYALHDGYVDHWLVAGPQVTVVDSHIDLHVPSHRLEILAQAARTLGIDVDDTLQPVEPATPAEGEGQDEPSHLRWRIFHCLEDHLLDLSDDTHRGVLTAWAYTGLESSEPRQVTLELTATGVADIWVNGEHVHRQPGTGETPEAHAGRPLTSVLDVALRQGANDILIRFTTVAPGPASFVLALRVSQPAAPLTVSLPTQLAPLERRNRLESVFEAAYLKQYTYTRYEKVTVYWPDNDEDHPLPEAKTSVTLRVLTPESRVYLESEREVEAGTTLDLGSTYRFPNGPLSALLMPRAREYYEGNMRVSRAIRFWGLDNEPYTDAPSGTFPERRHAVLLSAARRETGVYSELAKMALGYWSRLQLSRITETAQRLQMQGPYADASELLGFIGMLMRFGEDASFPEELKQPIRDAIISAVHHPEGGAMGHPESQALLAATCEVLAGQMCPETRFPFSGQTGAWHQAQGEAQALQWIQTRARQGFTAWGSDTVFAETILALAHLVDFAESDALWEMASVLLDKLFFLLGSHSFKGLFGSSRGWTQTHALFGGTMEATAPIAKLMWGTGIYNVQTAAPVSLALLENYELPVLLQAVATDRPDAVWSREHDGNAEGANTVVYKTPDFMLSAVQDYRAGEPGGSEHVWQATLGPGATVFTNHPGCAGLSDAQRPNFWRGNGVLPRVVQWQDALIALYRLPDDDWMGFTHAYFPVHAFDAHVLRDGWAFARVGDGYLALTAYGGLNLSHTGHAAERELRSPGLQNVWLCQMGRAALDGDFKAFQSRVLALPVAYSTEAPGVAWTTLRGDRLRLDWTGPCLKNDEPMQVAFERHIENAYCVAEHPADVLDIRYDTTVLRLTLNKPQETE